MKGEQASPLPLVDDDGTPIADDDDQAGRYVKITSPIPELFGGGEIMILTGASGSGKSTLIASLVRALRDGTPFLDFTPNHKPPKVGAIINDRGWQRSRDWFDREGIVEGRDEWFQAYCPLDDPDFQVSLHSSKSIEVTLDKRINELNKQLRKLRLPPGSVFIMDSILPYGPNNVSDYHQVRASLQRIKKEVLIPARVVGIGSTHTSKERVESAVKNARERSIGSVSWGAYSDTQLIISVSEQDPADSILEVQPRSGPATTWRLSRGKTGVYVQSELISGDAGKKTKKAKAKADDAAGAAGEGEQDEDDLDDKAFSLGAETFIKIQQVLPPHGAGYITVAEILTHTKIKKRTLMRYLAEMKRRGMVETPVRGCYCTAEGSTMKES